MARLCGSIRASSAVWAGRCLGLERVGNAHRAERTQVLKQPPHGASVASSEYFRIVLSRHLASAGLQKPPPIWGQADCISHEI